MAIVSCETLAAMNIVTYEFFADIWYGCVVELVYQSDDVYCVECL